MTTINVKTKPLTTHEGGRADHSTTFAKLQRAVASCMLWEGTFYEDGESIADRIEAYSKSL